MRRKSWRLPGRFLFISFLPWFFCHCILHPSHLQYQELCCADAFPFLLPSMLWLHLADNFLHNLEVFDYCHKGPAMMHWFLSEWPTLKTRIRRWWQKYVYVLAGIFFCLQCDVLLCMDGSSNCWLRGTCLLLIFFWSILLPVREVTVWTHGSHDCEEKRKRRLLGSQHLDSGKMGRENYEAATVTSFSLREKRR